MAHTAATVSAAAAQPHVVVVEEQQTGEIFSMVSRVVVYKALGIRVIAAIGVGGGTYSEETLPIFGHAADAIVGQRGELALLRLHDLKFLAVIAVQTVDSAEPDEAPAVLHYAAHGVLRQPVAVAYPLEARNLDRLRHRRRPQCHQPYQQGSFHG